MQKMDLKKPLGTVWVKFLTVKWMYHYNGGAYRTVSTKEYDVSSKKASALIDDINNPEMMF